MGHVCKYTTEQTSPAYSLSCLETSHQRKSQYEAVSRLLNFVQTAFVYEYDDKVWGCDRAFSRMKPFITRIAIVKTVQSYSPDWSAIC